MRLRGSLRTSCSIRVSGGAATERSGSWPLANLINDVRAGLRPKVFCVGEVADQGTRASHRSPWTGPRCGVHGPERRASTPGRRGRCDSRRAGGYRRRRRKAAQRRARRWVLDGASGESRDRGMKGNSWAPVNPRSGFGRRQGVAGRPEDGTGGPRIQAAHNLGSPCQLHALRSHAIGIGRTSPLL